MELLTEMPISLDYQNDYRLDEARAKQFRDVLQNPDTALTHFDEPKNEVDESILKLKSREIGELGERLSAQFLERAGIEVLERNLRTKGGEVDLVLNDNGERALCEVKSRLVCTPEQEDLMPEEAVTPAKQERYFKIAQFYLRDHPDVTTVRFDVCAVKIRGTHVASIHYMPAAFYADC